MRPEVRTKHIPDRLRVHYVLDEEADDYRECVRLCQRVGRSPISRFLEEVARERLKDTDLEAAYREMAADEARESEAAEWIEALAGDAADEVR